MDAIAVGLAETDDWRIADARKRASERARERYFAIWAREVTTRCSHVFVFICDTIGNDWKYQSENGGEKNLLALSQLYG